MSLPICKTTETACYNVATASLAAAGISGVSVVKGLDNDDVGAPAVLLYSDSAKEHFPFSGVWEVNTHIQVKQIAYDTTLVPSASLADIIFKTFLDDCTGLLNANAKYKCYDYWVSDTNEAINGDAWIEDLTLTIVGVIT